MKPQATQTRGTKRREETVPDIEDGPDAVEATPGPAMPEREQANNPKSTRLLIAGLALAVLIGISGVLAWVTASTSEELETARTRDAVLVTATQGIKTLNSLDYRKVPEGLKDWVSVSTGTLSDQLAGVSAEDRKLLADQKKISTGKVINASVVDLDKTTATVIAAVEVTVQDGVDKDEKPVIKRNRFSADMVLVKGVWKVENLVQVPVNLQ